MLVRQLMTTPVVLCTPWDTARAAAELMKVHGVRALPVVSDLSDPLLEGIVTDRDLCCGALASGGACEVTLVSEVMTPIPVTCESDSRLEDCLELMRENQVRRIPVVNEWARCIGIVSQADIARHAPGVELAATIREISAPTKRLRSMSLDRRYFYCGQSHELDQIALLKRRRQPASREEMHT